MLITGLFFAELKEGEPWMQKSTQEEMIAQFSGWADDIIDILKVNWMRWARETNDC
jgi:hypothetical protein